jgi:hypothetical protein
LDGSLVRSLVAVFGVTLDASLADFFKAILFGAAIEVVIVVF